MEVETAIRRLLLEDSTVKGYVQRRVYKYRLEEPVDNTGQRAIVILRIGGWGAPDPRKTSEFPVVEVQCWADHQREEDQSIKVADGPESAWALYRVVNMVLHGQRDARWGENAATPGLPVVSSARFVEPTMIDTPEYEAVYVQARYALQVVHGVLAGKAV